MTGITPLNVDRMMENNIVLEGTKRGVLNFVSDLYNCIAAQNKQRRAHVMGKGVTDMQ